jgi:hypothetical protein
MKTMLFRLRLIFISLALTASCFQTFSQCQEEVDKANRLFDEGLFREAEKVTKLALETCDFNKHQYDEMLKLLASIYFEMDEIELGNQYMADFLKRNPFYIGNKRSDPLQFRQALRKLKAFPRFSVALKGGSFFGQVDTKKVFPVLDTADYLQDYTIKPVFQGGIETSLNLNSYFSVGLESNIRIQKMFHQVPQYSQITFHYQENNFSASFPFTIGFSFPQGRLFSAKVYAGAEIAYFLQATYSYYYSIEGDISGENSVYLNKKKENVIIEPSERNTFRYGALAGLRVIYKLNRFNVFSDFRLKKEFTPYNNPDKRFADSDLFLANHFAIADISMDYFDLSIGLSYSFSYKVKSKY